MNLIHTFYPCLPPPLECPPPEEPIDEEKLREVIAGTGYTPGEVTSAPYEKKGLFFR